MSKRTDDLKAAEILIGEELEEMTDDIEEATLFDTLANTEGQEEKIPSRELVRTMPRQLTADDWQMIMAVAPAMAAANMFGTTEAGAMAIMLKGHELGLGLAASFELIHVIQGKPSLSPRGALALLYNHPDFEGIEVKETNDDEGEAFSCEVTIDRKGFGSSTATFTLKDAERAGLVKPSSGWVKYPANMLRWRAIGYAIDLAFPDTGGGMKRADEYGADLHPNGEIIEGSWAEVPAYEGKRSRQAREEKAKQEDEADQRLKQAGEIVQTLGEETSMNDRVAAIAQGLSIPPVIAMALNTALVMAENEEAQNA